ncbi:MAG: 30S ribosomal protein S3, partial [Planctomycetes bacterium]|nr:30S ribosomal protein S3 [Planctomycetota bacterium]
MGQKVNPIGFRIGITEDWRSRWYAPKKEFGALLIEDYKIRSYIKEKYPFAGIPKIEIERTRDQVVIHIFTARPGIIIGRKGQEIDRLKDNLESLTGRRMELKIVEINNARRSAA